MMLHMVHIESHCDIWIIYFCFLLSPHLSFNCKGHWGTTEISQPVSSIFPCSPLPSGTWQTPGLSICWCCLPTSSSVCCVYLCMFMQTSDEVEDMLSFWPSVGIHDVVLAQTMVTFGPDYVVQVMVTCGPDYGDLWLVSCVGLAISWRTISQQTNTKHVFLHGHVLQP